MKISTVELGEITEIVTGTSPKGDTCNSEGRGIPLLNGPTEFGLHHPIPEQFTTSPKKFANQGDLLFCVRGSTTGRMNWADQKYAIGRGIAAIRSCESHQLQPFIRALIEFKLTELLRSATGSTFPNVSGSQLRGLDVPAHPLPIQRRIADILGALDDKIELNRRMNETLEAMAQTLYRHWFVDFGPFQDQPFVDSELGPIPEGWHVTEVDDIAKFRNGKRPESTSTDGSYLIWGANGPTGQNDDFLFDENILLTGRVGTLGNVFRITFPVWPSDNTITIRPKEDYTFEFLYHTIKRIPFSTISRGSTQPLLAQKDIKSQRFALPPKDLIVTFGEHLDRFYQLVDANKSQNEHLSETRDYLLPKLISGEIEVEAAEEEVNSAVA